MRSIFSFRIALLIFLVFPMGVLLVILTKITAAHIHQQPAWVLGLAFLIFCILWIVMGELRTRVIRVNLEDDRITVREFAGLGKTRVFYFNELDGYITNILPSRSGEYEYLFIHQHGRRVIRLSQLYHRNYAELKQQVGRK